ncbi:hypothetical protein PAA26_04555 [Methanomassiliicoccaceae archaeon COG_1]|nr:hypothetical protein [Methanomassiliicoccaceae archaeon COG_1]
MRSLVSDSLKERLEAAQMKLASRGVPVLIVFEGNSGRAITRVVNEVSRCLEPMGIAYHHFDPAEMRGTKGIAAMLAATPGKGDIALYDRSWYSRMISEYNLDEGDGERWT